MNNVNVRLGELSVLLQERGYGKKVIESALERVRALERSSMLEKVVRQDTEARDRVRAIFKFDRRLPNLSWIFKKTW